MQSPGLANRCPLSVSKTPLGSINPGERREGGPSLIEPVFAPLQTTYPFPKTSPAQTNQLRKGAGCDKGLGCSVGPVWKVANTAFCLMLLPMAVPPDGKPKLRLRRHYPRSRAHIDSTPPRPTDRPAQSHRNETPLRVYSPRASRTSASRSFERATSDLSRIAGTARSEQPGRTGFFLCVTKVYQCEVEVSHQNILTKP